MLVKSRPCPIGGGNGISSAPEGKPVLQRTVPLICAAFVPLGVRDVLHRARVRCSIIDQVLRECAISIIIAPALP